MTGARLTCLMLFAASLVACGDDADETSGEAVPGITQAEKERVIRECRREARSTLGVTGAEMRAAETVTDRPLTADESLYLAHSKPCLERGGLIVLDTDEGRIVATPKP